MFKEYSSFRLSIGVGAATACALYATQAAIHPFISTFDHHRAAQLLLTLPGFPLQALDGLVLGFVLAKRLGGWSSGFAWAAPFGLENTVVLSDDFYNEITSHPIPTDLEAVKVLAGAPAVLDLFMWLSYRCHISKREERIPIFGPFGLAQQLGSVEYSRPRRFRVKLEQWLDTIRVLWSECPARITADGQTLSVDAGSAVK